MQGERWSVNYGLVTVIGGAGAGLMSVFGIGRIAPAVAPSVALGLMAAVLLFASVLGARPRARRVVRRSVAGRASAIEAQRVVIPKLSEAESSTL